LMTRKVWFLIMDTTVHPHNENGNPSKKCTGSCGRTLPATSEYFDRDKQKVDGLASRCKFCRKQYNAAHREEKRAYNQQYYTENKVVISEQKKQYAAEHKEKLAAYNRQWYQDHKESQREYKRHYNSEYRDKVIERRKRYYEVNKEYINARSNRYYAEHREEILAQKKRHYAENRDEIVVRRRRYRSEHRDYINARIRRHRAEHREQYKRYRHSPEYRKQYYARRKEELAKRRREWRESRIDRVRLLDRIQSHNRRAFKRQSGGTYTLEQIQEQYKRQKSKCYYCYRKVKWGDHHVDHVVPLSRGGSNDISNLVISCASCNLKKHNRLPHEFPDGGRLL
jgi:5-methylcytosine-specific restriction endonuclease McrA